MQFVCLVNGKAKELDSLPEAERRQIDMDSKAYDHGLEQSGHLIVAQALRPIEETVTVRKRGKKVTVTDGPFAETKEQLLGFILMEAADMEEAVRIAADIPLAAYGTIEVRQVMKFD